MFPALTFQNLRIQKYLYRSRQVISSERYRGLSNVKLAMSWPELEEQFDYQAENLGD